MSDQLETKQAMILAAGLTIGVLVVVVILWAVGLATGAFNVAAGALVTLTANPSGGSSPYTYQWYTGTSCSTIIANQIGQTFTPTSLGGYSVLITDSQSSTVCPSIVT